MSLFRRRAARAATLFLLATSSLAACDDLATAPSGPATLIVKNETTTPVEYLYISECSNTGWGNDQLGPNEMIASGNERKWTLDPGCYDVRAKFRDSSIAESHDLNLEPRMEFTVRLRG